MSWQCERCGETKIRDDRNRKRSYPIGFEFVFVCAPCWRELTKPLLKKEKAKV